MEHSNLDLLGKKHGKNDFTSEHYMLQEAIDLQTKVDWQSKFKLLREEESPSVKKLKRELDRNFKKLSFRPR
jgi:hypothetical protein